MKAIPTEYKGVRYRSKCEAQFAFWLHWVHSSFDRIVCPVDERKGNITQDGCTGFEYEPKLPGEFQCDFLTWKAWMAEGHVLPQLMIEFIEYKPSRPTDTYIKNWAAKADVCRSSIENDFKLANSYRFRIYYGSAYTKLCGIVTVGESGQTDESQLDWCDRLRDDMISYRFDLQGGM